MTDIGLGHYLTLSGVIFTIGIAGIFLNSKNIIVILRYENNTKYGVFNDFLFCTFFNF